MTTDPLYIDKDFIVMYKPSLIPSVPLKTKCGGTFLDDVKLSFPEVASPFGKNPWEGGVIHRLDTPTSGLVLFARTQQGYDWILSEQSSDRVIKKYRATFSDKRDVDEGFEPFPYGDVTREGGRIESYFRSFGKGAKSVRPVLANKRNISGRLYTTYVTPETDNSVICTLSRGFRHQVRCHMAWSGHPLIGDELYGAKESDRFGLEAIEIAFRNLDGKEILVSV